ncbi:MAG: peptide ABC transporter substrate-binding protein [Chloroflexi bacterium]|jgi:peptide/nickel transport system substrate-binding protein|nr:peptide ABC transporter substrate-binding protein [Chloroflexota bacterium]MBT4002951.1 peptide ABC transporter substrate-binding protein [Chloroflexota bacterium]MBT4305801.1 peptide ABC transporter substrate-binding protein [Chloroflexota bacterium]MBT4533625.1 peptide ABC transporter substrate-binding protein [Chloroflexota bacterium]MBT4681732.1 peptide ABC transporter substrate-binding protein [Chloroflexota bacterium]
MKKLRWQILIVVAALIAIAVLLYGQQPVLETIIAQEPSTGGVYTEGLVGSPIRYNPILDFYNQVDRDVDRLIFSSMIRFDDWGNPIADLAESWGVSVTSDVYNITLHENILWHDGETLTTDDILFTIELLRDSENPVPEDIAALWQSVEVVVFDELNIQFRLEESFSPFVDYLSFGILPRHLLEGKSGETLIGDGFNLSPVGSGPYQFEGLLSENREITGIVLTASEEHYAERPLIDQIVFRYFGSDEEALAAYQNGEISGISNISGNMLSGFMDEVDLNAYTSRLPELSMILFNLDKDELLFFQDIEVRKALYHAINRPWIISQALNGQALIAEGPIFPNSWAYYDATEKYPFDATLAIDILRDSEYVIPADGGNIRSKDGVSLSFELIHLDDEIQAEVAKMIKEYWAAIGVNVVLMPLDAETMMTTYLETREYDAALVNLNLMRTPDPDPYPFWHQSQITNGQNYSGWNDRRASEYLEKARVTPERSDRERLYRNFQVHFSREIPALPLFFPVYTYFVDAEVGGINFGSVYDQSDRFKNIQEWYLVSRLEVQEPIAPTNSVE